MLGVRLLTKRYGDLVAVADVSLDVPRGRIVGFVGPNGAGKSTTMRAIFGLVRPDAGTFTWDGAPIGPTELARFGYMPEQRGLYPKMRVLEQVRFFAELKGVDRVTADRRARAILESVGLGDRLGDPVEKLSHGNQQRAQLAVAFVTDPELLVLDEPFNGLDPVAVETLQAALRERVAGGAGVLFSSHQLDLVERICDDVVLITDGVIRARGTVRTVRESVGVRSCTIEFAEGVAEAAAAFAHLGARVRQPRPEIVVVDVETDAALEPVLAAARALGALHRFDYDLPSLQEAFVALTGVPGASLQPSAAVAP